MIVLPNNYVVPDTSIFDPRLQSNTNVDGLMDENDIFLEDLPDGETTTFLEDGSALDANSASSLGAASGNTLASVQGSSLIPYLESTLDEAPMDSVLFEDGQGDDQGDEGVESF